MLPCDATPMQRLLAYEPKTGPGWRHWHYLVAKLVRELGLPTWRSPGDGNPATSP